MRLLSGASLSCVTTTAWLATRLSIPVWFLGSTGLMAIPLTPFASRSSMMLCCSAAVPPAGILNSTSMSGISFAAFSVPLRAMVQNSDGLLVTKASLCFVPEPPPAVFVPEGEGLQAANSRVSNNVQTQAEISRMDFSGRIGFLDTEFGLFAKDVYHKGFETQST